MSRLARLLLWDHARGSLPYDVLSAILLALIFLVPAAFWGDPMAGR